MAGNVAPNDRSRKENVMADLFLSNYTVGNPIPGAPVLNLNLSVDSMKKIETGKANLSQAVNPPLKLTSEIQGTYTNLNNKVFLAAVAKDDTFGVTIAVPKFGDAGEGSFWYRDKDRIVQIGPVPAVPEKTA